MPDLATQRAALEAQIAQAQEQIQQWAQTARNAQDQAMRWSGRLEVYQEQLAALLAPSPTAGKEQP